MCQILMSINPEHVEKILNGTKKYEFRKHASKIVPDKIIIYCTTPVQRIVGEVEVKEVLQDKPSKIWSITSSKSGINKEFFDSYYDGRNTAVAYKLGAIKKYNKQKTLRDFGIKVAPQSYMYISQ